MGMFSFIGDLLGDITGTTKAGEAAEKAAGESLEFQEKGLDYLKEVQKLPLEFRDKALSELGGFYGLDPGGQQDIIDRAKSSPLYGSMLEQGRQGVGSALSATGNLRGGLGPSSFYQQDQNVLQGAVDQQLRGLSGFAGTPIDTSQIVNQYSNMGDITAGGILARGRSSQDALGMGVDIAKAIAMI